ncbi:MAG TPA: TSUP family transporter [Burkholderiales bacterium]|nr:TSUP family transporter [Burkholderiales bacterium]
MLSDYLILGIAALLAGMVDAVVGGGGLIQVPALFAVYPTASPPTLLGTGKMSSIVGTVGASVRYVRHQPVAWAVVLPAALAAFLCAAMGAYAITLVPAEPLRKALPFILLVLLLYMLRKKDLGLVHQPRHNVAQQRRIATGGGALVGFYDGILGAGTGAFLKLLFVRGLGFDFLTAAAPAKLVNVGANLGALLVFGFKGHIWWALGAWMMLNNFIGGQIGSWFAIKKGAHFIRVVFIAVVGALIVKTFFDAFIKTS